MRNQMVWDGELDMTIGDSRFHCTFNRHPDPPDSIPIMKTPPMIDAYVELLREMDPRRVVELGIRQGGSTAFLHAFAEPELLVAVELNTRPAPALAAYVERFGVADVVRPHYGVDQADRTRLAEIVDGARGGAPLDLVVDDASHLYEPTLASFEVLFPRLRPGGRFVIEDWTARSLMLDRWAAGFDASRTAALEEHLRRVGFPRPEPLLSLLSLELVLARASVADVVADVHVDRYWTTVTRGTEPLDPDTFRLRDHYRDHMRLFAEVLGADGHGRPTGPMSA